MPGDDAPPAGSQRGLAILREAVDEAAAERGAYASLMTVTSAFAAPEQAVVAAFERIDLVEADPLREIVEDSIDPDRALADHAFAHRLEVLSGCSIVIGPGPLALGPDLERGIPSTTVSRAGVALALQVLGVELALVDGLPPKRLLVGAVPGWLALEADPAAIVAQAWLRRAVFLDHPLVVEDPGTESGTARSSFPLAAALVATKSASIVFPGRRDGAASSAALDLRAAVASSAGLSAAITIGTLQGIGERVASETLAAANLALRRLRDEGWDAILGPAPSQAAGLGRSAVVTRTYPGDPLVPPAPGLGRYPRG